jgi:hypothetical protein
MVFAEDYGGVVVDTVSLVPRPSYSAMYMPIKNIILHIE